MRTCPFTGCEVQVPDHIFACGRHWHSLNPTQKRRIYAGYGRYQADEIGLEELRRLQKEVLDEAQNKAGLFRGLP